jgi:hypothetical protein
MNPIEALSQMIGFCGCLTGQCREVIICWIIAERRMQHFCAEHASMRCIIIQCQQSPTARPFESTRTHHINASTLLLGGRGSLLALIALLSSSVGVYGRTGLSAGGETAGAHVLSTLSL